MKPTRNGVRHQFTLWFRRQVHWALLWPVAVGDGPPDALVPVVHNKHNVTAVKRQFSHILAYNAKGGNTIVI